LHVSLLLPPSDVVPADLVLGLDEVVAVVPLDRVVALAARPDVVALLAEIVVGPGPAGELVLLVPSVQVIVAAASVEDVVPVVAVDRVVPGAAADAVVLVGARSVAFRCATQLCPGFAFRGDYTGASQPARARNAVPSTRDTVTEAASQPGSEETS
jgi:hypothetical protein